VPINDGERGKDMLEFFRWRQRGASVVYECRNCGASLSPLEVEDEYCRYCGPTGIVRYEVT
jgi:DNA-directed RNA polymerase subunit RPC12/RpoP